MQLVLSPVKMDANTNLTGLKGLEVSSFLALVQQDLQDAWAIGELLFAGHLSRTLLTRTFSSWSGQGMVTTGEEEAQAVAVRPRRNRCGPHLQ